MTTPVQRQYADLKKQNPDAILFFQLGEFYELFYEDARIGARILGIQLTARHKGTDNEMPMCGFPIKAHKEYLTKLVEHGYKVAIADQVTDPETKQIDRKVSQVITPGTRLEGDILDPDLSSYLCAVLEAKDLYALAYTDISTGEFRTANFPDKIAFLTELFRVNPREILIPSGLYEDESFCAELPKTLLTPRPDIKSAEASKVLKEHFGLHTLDGLGLAQFDLCMEVSAMILSYVYETQKQHVSHIREVKPYSVADFMQLDEQTMRHLEIFEPIQRAPESATLLSVFPRPHTSMGCRRLRQWLLRPLMKRDQIEARHDAVANVVDDRDLRHAFDTLLEKIPDIERISSKLGADRAHPRDLSLLRDALSSFPGLRDTCLASRSPLIQEQSKAFNDFDQLYRELSEALGDEVPLEVTTGGIFRDGYHADLDILRAKAESSQAWLENYLLEQKEVTGIPTLRVKFSKNFGFCLEVSQAQKEKVPDNWTRRQTLVNAERFTTPELAQYEEDVLGAESQAFALEHELFLELRENVTKYIPQIQTAAYALSVIDTLFTLSMTAVQNRWKRPQIIEKRQLQITQGRHPVVESLGTQFIANDLSMDSKTFIHLITGPNMAGKSTFLRQNAILILLAQMGSFVPAKEMKLPIYDRIFTRVGASDNLAAGKSTFYTEMSESAHILRSASEKSFVILDEIGRGTSTFDGLSLAWAITEYIHNDLKAQTLFATHYHELIELGDTLTGAENYHVSATRGDHGIIFLRQIKKGGMADSFGIEVAKVAGIPDSVVDKAQKILAKLESEQNLSDQMTLFSQTKQEPHKAPDPSQIDIEIANLSLDDMTPLQALKLLHQLKQKISKK